MFVKILEDRKALDEQGVQPSYAEIQATQAMPNSYFSAENVQWLSARMADP